MIVTVAVPVVAFAAAVKVTTLVVPVVDAGLNAAVTPAGRPAALNVTAAAKPFWRVMRDRALGGGACTTVRLPGSRPA